MLGSHSLGAMKTRRHLVTTPMVMSKHWRRHLACVSASLLTWYFGCSSLNRPVCKVWILLMHENYFGRIPVTVRACPSFEPLIHRVLCSCCCNISQHHRLLSMLTVRIIDTMWYIDDLQEIREVEEGDGWWRDQSVCSWTQEEAFVTVRGEIHEFLSFYSIWLASSYTAIWPLWS